MWFIPFILCTTVLVNLGARMIGPSVKIRSIVAFGSMLLGLAISLCPSPAWIDIAAWNNYALALVWRAIPSIFYGVGMAVVVQKPQLMSFLRRTSGAVVGAVVALAGSLLVVRTGYPNYWSENLAGLGWILVGLASFGGQWIRVGAQLGELSYGVYLVHVVFVEGLQAVAARAHVQVGAKLDISVFLLSVVGSFASAWLLTRSRATK